MLQKVVAAATEAFSPASSAAAAAAAAAAVGQQRGGVPSTPPQLRHVRALMDQLTAEDFSGLLDPAAAVDRWRRAGSAWEGRGGGGDGSSSGSTDSDDDNGSRLADAPPGAIYYQHVADSLTFSMGVFVLPPYSSIPLHDHPNMCVLSRVLCGDLQVRSFDLVGYVERSTACMTA
jgi:hypothetical protein